MKYPINFNRINRKMEYYDEIIKCHSHATEYIKSYYWCKEIKGSSLYTNLGWVLCIFLFDIVNASSEEDNLLWLIVGDIPSMYLDVFGPKTTIQVLELYSALAEDWIKQIKSGGSIEECYPFKANPTTEMAELLQLKVNQIKNNLIPNIDEISIQPL